MPDMEKVIKDLEEVREYIARKGHDLASRKCRMMDKVTDAIALLKELQIEIEILKAMGLKMPEITVLTDKPIYKVDT